MLGEVKQTRIISDSVAAFFGADAGVERALYQLCKQNDKSDQSNQPVGSAQYSYAVDRGVGALKVVSTGSFRASRRTIEVSGFTESAGTVDCGTPPTPTTFTLSSSGNVNLPFYISGSKPTVDSTITVTLTSGAPQLVSLSLTNDPFIPAGVTATFNPSSCTPNPTCTSQLTFKNAGSMWAGWWTAKVSGNDGTATNDTSFGVTIPAPSCDSPLWTIAYKGDTMCSIKAYYHDFVSGGGGPFYWYINDFVWPGGPSVLSTMKPYLDPNGGLCPGTILPIPCISTVIPGSAQQNGPAPYRVKVYRTTPPGGSPGPVACTGSYPDPIITCPFDGTPPAAVTDLTASGATASSINLSWTAPGDDGTTGTASSYDIRYSTSAITDANWGSATQVSGEPSPLVAGSAQSMTVSGLSASTLYYFAMKTSDEIPYVSALSNVPSLSTLISYILTINKSGSGNGTVTSSPAGIDCGSTCSKDYPFDTVVTLTASASGGSTFDAWSGAGCSGSGTCIVTMAAAKSVTATFNLPPIAHWKMEETANNQCGAGKDVCDSSGNNNHGDANGASIVIGGGIGGSNARSFDGINDYVDTAAKTWGISNNFTVSAWIYAASDDNRDIWTIGNSGDYNEAGILGLRTPRQLMFLFYDNPGGTTYRRAVSATNVVPLNTWTHVVGVVNNNEMYVYINGVDVTSTRDGGGVSLSDTSRTVFLSKWPTGSSDFFNGKIDEVAIYDQAFSSTQICGLYKAQSGSVSCP
ncbi:fibronectin type III domain-containing protein [Candidatus Parcubacteria bacterium]|nr:fibronectin type III domain-containing protein [Candidatus Parcubacteria bacterium]